MDDTFEYTEEVLEHAKHIDPEWRSLCCSLPVYHIPEKSGGGLLCGGCGRKWRNMGVNAYFTTKPDDWDAALAALKIMQR